MLTRRDIFLGLGSVGLGAAFAGTPAFAQNVQSVVTTTGMIADVARNIGSPFVTVQALMGPGVDPHAYRQTRNDIIAMSKADLVLYHGLDLEAQMLKFFDKLKTKTRVTSVTDGLERASLLPYEGVSGKFDPHIWMDVSLWSQIIETVVAELSAIVPSHVDHFQENGERLRQDLRGLHDYGQSALSTVPVQNRTLVTAHDAFRYFGAAYGLEVLGVQGMSTNSEAGLFRIKELVDFLVTRKIPSVFVESSVAERNVRALIEGAASRGHKVSLGGKLYSDAMGPEGRYEGTYIGMMDHNITVIARALGGDVHAAGLNGKLRA